MSEETVERLIFDVLAKGYQEEIISLLKYRRLAKSLERLYGSQDLKTILEDEERHARLFLEVAREMDFDVASIGERALIEELNVMAGEESEIADQYNEVLRAGRITNERVLALLKAMANDSRMHSRLLNQLSEKLETVFADRRQG